MAMIYVIRPYLVKVDKHTLNGRAAQGAKVFHTMTVKTIKMSMTYVGNYKDMHL